MVRDDQGMSVSRGAIITWGGHKSALCFATARGRALFVRSWGYPRTGKSRQMWPHCGVLSQHPLFDVAKEGRSISALFFFPLQRHLLACNDHTYVLRVSDSWPMRTRVLVGKSLSFHTGNDGIMWFHVHGRHQAVAPIAACRKEFSIFNSFVAFFTQLSCPRMKGAITLSRYNYS